MRPEPPVWATLGDAAMPSSGDVGGLRNALVVPMEGRTQGSRASHRFLRRRRLLDRIRRASVQSGAVAVRASVRASGREQHPPERAACGPPLRPKRNDTEPGSQQGMPPDDPPKRPVPCPTKHGRTLAPGLGLANRSGPVRGTAHRSRTEGTEQGVRFTAILKTTGLGFLRSGVRLGVEGDR